MKIKEMKIGNSGFVLSWMIEKRSDAFVISLEAELRDEQSRVADTWVSCTEDGYKAIMPIEAYKRLISDGEVRAIISIQIQPLDLNVAPVIIEEVKW